MHRPTGALLILACLLAAAHPSVAAAEAKPGTTIFVAPGGNDTWSGTLADPNAAKTDGPLATLDAARDKIRALRKNAKLPPGGVTVVLRGGRFYLPKTFELEKADSGTADAPIVYRSADGEKVTLIGGRPITGFTTHRGSVLKADVAKQGFKGIYFRQLFCGDQRQQLARWPNFDPKEPYTGGWAYVDGKPPYMYKDLPTDSRRILQYKKDDARNWQHPEEAEVSIFTRYNWWNNIVPIASIDPQKRTITLAADTSYAIRPDDRYFVRNLLEELDSPGEWYLDRKTETLYFWPPSPNELDVYAPTMDSLVRLGPGTEWVTIRGMTMICCEGTAVAVRDANDCLVAGNTIFNVGRGVSVRNGLRDGVVGNDIHHTNGGAVSLYGGDRITLTPAGHYADNNHIFLVGVQGKGSPGIYVEGVGNRATHNLVHDCPRVAIQLNGNNLSIEYNHLHHAALETEDISAIYTGGRDWISSRGSRVCYNFIHDVFGLGRVKGKWVSPHFCSGIYLDDNTGGVDVIGNIVARAPRAPLYLHNARDSVIENNIFVDGPNRQIEYRGWRSDHSFWTRHVETMVKGYESVASQPAWKAMRHMDISPRNAVLPDGLIMANNVVKRNILYGSAERAKPYTFENVPLDHNVFDENLVYVFGHPIAITYRPADKYKDCDTPVDSWPRWWQKLGQDRHSLVGDPLFVDPQNDDYRLRPESPAFKLGFKPIPVDKIGPYADPLRASWPIVEGKHAGRPDRLTSQ